MNQDSFIEELAEEFRLPITHRVTENVDLEDVVQASLETKITSSNVGFRLLQKMGWKGKGLGKQEQGLCSVSYNWLFKECLNWHMCLIICDVACCFLNPGITEPIKSGIRDRRLGLGKQEEDDYFTAEENIQRRKLDIEIEETEEIAKKREVCDQKHIWKSCL